MSRLPETITLDHVREALHRVKTNALPKGHGYDQSQWCGTACCLWGHAHLVAGLKASLAEGGPSVKWGSQSLAHQIARGAMLSRYSDRAQAILTIALELDDGSRVDLRGADLNGLDLRGTDLRGANLSGADLREANMSGANLRGANLSGANLSGADLREANMSGANLRGANLSEANLRETYLYRANLRGANLSGADLHGADLRGALMSEEGAR